MKKSYLILLLCLVSLSGFARLGLNIKVNVCVVNENREPIINAKVGTSFYRFVDEKDPWKGQKSFRNYAVSDINGKCSFSEKSLNRFSVGVQKDGYYGSGKVFRLADKDLERGRWLPYERNVELVMREIKNPIAMYAWGLHLEKYPVTTNQWVGFDMLLADWMPPHGLGKVEDARFQISQDLEGDGLKKPQRVLDIEFPGAKNGLQALDDRAVSYNSHFKFPYSAPKDGYLQKNLILEKWRNQVEYKDITNIGSTNCFFRIRSKVAKNGDFVEGLYGKVQGPIDFQGRSKRLSLRMIYYVNPTPNDLNMEFDPEKNLIKKKGIRRSVIFP